ncbi:MAG: hypothetical protein AB1486_17770 [Planctomycetota bacterium]
MGPILLGVLFTGMVCPDGASSASDGRNVSLLPASAVELPTKSDGIASETCGPTRPVQGREPSLTMPAFAELPLYFIENRGQTDERVAYYVKGRDKTLHFTSEGVTFSLCETSGPALARKHRVSPLALFDETDAAAAIPEASNSTAANSMAATTAGADDGAAERWVVKLAFVGARPDVEPRGEDRQDAVFGYFKGRQENWKTGIPTYAKLVYEDLWPGIDLAYSGTVDRLKYEFVVQPDADPDLIRLEYTGATQVTVTGEGTLQIETPLARFGDATPYAYQVKDGARSEVSVRYSSREPSAEGASAFGFELGEFDRAQPLVIDPEMLVYCGYVGGAADDWGLGIAVDATGAAYVAGYTYSDETQFPVSTGPDTAFNGYHDAFVAKVNPQGTGLVYCGYIGGGARDWGWGIAVDATGAAYVTGYTESDQASFPVTVGPDIWFNGLDDAFVAKVNPQGTSLVYCGYIGGFDREYAKVVAVDAQGAAHVMGWTASDEHSFPVTVGPDVTYNGGDADAFVAKVHPQGWGLVYCGYVGGAEADYAYGVARDATGAAYMVGTTYSDEQTFPVIGGPDVTYNGRLDGFVAKVAPGGTGLVYCGYIGGLLDDLGYGIAVDAEEAAYVTGRTWSDQVTFPVKVGPDLSHNGGIWDAYVAKVNAAGTDFVYCGYVGGADWDDAMGIAVGPGGTAYLAGRTWSDETSFPVTLGPDLTFNGDYDGFIAKVNALGTGLAFCGYIGGDSVDDAYGLAVDAAGSAYLAGYTGSNESTFPEAWGPDLTFNGGGFDSYVAKVPNIDGLDASWCNYGSGWPGTKGVPEFVASGEPVLCAFITLEISNSLGAPTTAFLLLGLEPTSLPTQFGGTMLVLPKWVLSLFLLPTGSTVLPGQIPCEPGFAGLRLYLQILELDPGASHGISFTLGLELVFGYW